MEHRTLQLLVIHPTPSDVVIAHYTAAARVGRPLGCDRVFLWAAVTARADDGHRAAHHRSRPRARR